MWFNFIRIQFSFVGYSMWGVLYVIVVIQSDLLRWISYNIKLYMKFLTEWLNTNQVIPRDAQLCLSPQIEAVKSMPDFIMVIRQRIRSHDDVMKWKHFPRNWPFVRGIHRPPVNSPHKGQLRGALKFSLIFVWINDWVTIVRLVIWDVIASIMTSLQWTDVYCGACDSSVLWYAFLVDINGDLSQLTTIN